MSQSLISVIVPVYNVKEYLNTCVESILNQTHENLEVILVDDGSTDGSGSLVGAVLMSVVSVASNYFIVYPVYTAFMPMEAIINAYQVILPQADTLLKCLVIFNMPFTFAKGMMNVLITFLVYKHISPIIKGAQER